MQHPMMLEQSIHHLDLIRFCYDRPCGRGYLPHMESALEHVCLRQQRQLPARSRRRVGSQLSRHVDRGWNTMQFEWRTDCADGVIVQRELFDNLAWAKIDGHRTAAIPIWRPAKRSYDDTAALWQAFISARAGGCTVVVQWRRPPCHARSLFRSDREQRDRTGRRFRRLLPQAWHRRSLMRILLTGAAGFVGAEYRRRVGSDSSRRCGQRSGRRTPDRCRSGAAWGRPHAGSCRRGPTR